MVMCLFSEGGDGMFNAENIYIMENSLCQFIPVYLLCFQLINLHIYRRGSCYYI